MYDLCFRPVVGVVVLVCLSVYCNSLYYKLPKSQLSRLQQIQNSLARTVMKVPKSSYHSYPTLSSLAQDH